jgi:Ca2+-binding RTX toxin-like protein
VRKTRRSGRSILAAAAVVVVGLVATASWAANIAGTAKNDTLRGTAKADRISGGGGNDKLYGLGGNDVLNGGPGSDLLVGGPGADALNCGPGHDTAIADTSDKLVGCEVVKGLPKSPPPAPPPPPPTTTTTTTPPPPAVAKPGIYCGFSEQGPGLCLTTSDDGTAVVKFDTSAIIDCTGGSRWTFEVTISGASVLLQSDLSFSYTFNGTLTDSSGQLQNIKESEFVKGTFTTDGKADGTLALSTVSFDYAGQHYDCTQNPVGWHVAKQG